MQSLWTPERLDPCAEPLVAPELSADLALMADALGLPPKPGELLVLRVSPWLERPGTLSLRRAADGSHVLRPIHLSAHAWMDLRSSGIQKVLESRSVHERVIDPETAQQLLTVSKALIERQQLKFTAQEWKMQMDGATYELLGRDGAVAIWSPDDHTAFGLAIAGMNHLARAIDAPGTQDCRQLALGTHSLEAALARARAEPCDRRVEVPSRRD